MLTAFLTRLERASHRSAQYRWYALAITTFCQAASVSLTQAIGPLAPLIQNDYQVSRAEIGLIITFISLSSLCVALLGGKAADSVGERRVLIVSGVVAAFAAIIIAGAGTFWAFLGACFVLGLGTGIQNPAGSAAVMRWFPPRQRGLAMGVRQTGVPVGGILSAALWPLVALLYSWRTSYLLGGLATLLGAALIFVGYFDPERRGAAAHDQPRSLRKLLGDRRIWWFGLIWNAQIVAQFTATAYFVLFVHEVLNVSVVAASAMLAVINGAAMIARIGWGMLSDLHFRGRRRPVLVIVVVLTLLGMLMAAAMPSDAPWLYALVLAALLGASAFGWTGVLGTFVIETAGRGSAATAVALVSTLGSPGSVLGPPIFGLIVDQTGGNYRVAWLSSAAVVCLGLFALVKVSERSLRAGPLE